MAKCSTCYVAVMAHGTSLGVSASVFLITFGISLRQQSIVWQFYMWISSLYILLQQLCWVKSRGATALQHPQFWHHWHIVPFQANVCSTNLPMSYSSLECSLLQNSLPSTDCLHAHWVLNHLNRCLQRSLNNSLESLKMLKLVNDLLRIP